MRVMVPDYLTGELLPALRGIDPSTDLLPVTVDGRYSGQPDGVEVLFRFFTNDRYPGRVFGAAILRELLQKVPTIRWIHNGTTGVDTLLFPELVESDVILTNGSGAHRRAIAETVLGFILADAKALVTHLSHQRRRLWQHVPHQELGGKTVAVLGLGKVGTEIARLCQLLGMRAVGTKRSLPASLPCDVAEVFSPERQAQCVRGADYVVVAASATHETRGMVDRETLAAMRPTAVLINVARGDLIDEAALLETLRSRSIRAAYLDVFATEPLPSDSPFFDLDNVVITPHNAAWSPNVIWQACSIFLDNFRRCVAGEPLLNVVDKLKGY